MRLAGVLLANGLVLLVVLTLAGWLAPTAAGFGPARVVSDNSITSVAYLYHLDPSSGSFITISLPPASRPADVQVVSGPFPQQIWFSEPGLRRIGRVVYTSSLDYRLDEFDVGAAPQALAASDTAVWFTLPEQNQVGRLDVASGAVASFDLPTAQADPADIAMDSNGQAWVTERAANRLAFVTISPTVAITEYALPASGLKPEGVTLDDDGNVWFAASATGYLWRFTPASGEYVASPPLGSGSYPDRLAQSSSNYLWATLQHANQLARILIGTSPYVTVYTVTTPESQPGAIGVDSYERVFFAEQATAQIGQLVVTPTASITEYPLPQAGLKLTGLAVGGDDSVWAVAYRDIHQVYLPVVTRDYDGLVYKVRLPIVMQNYDTTPGPYSIQMYGSIRHTADFTRVVESGASWVRLTVLWSNIEPVNTTPDHYNWADVDASVQTATEAGIHLILTIDENPGWAAARPTGPVYNPADLQEFVRALIARYPQVEYWEFYNEPDSIDHFGYPHNVPNADHGAEYAAMLKSVYPVVKTANPHAKVVMGGLGLDWFTENKGVFDSQFLRGVLSHCVGTCFDVANVHYYPFWRKVWESYGRDVIGKVNYVRQFLAANGYARPVLCTESSWPSATFWGSTDLQARYVPKLYVRGFAAGLAVMNWYAWIDADTTNSGLLGPGLTPRPAYSAYQTLTSLTSHARFVRTIPSSETGSGWIEGYQLSVPGAGGWKRLDVYWYDCPSLYSFPSGSWPKDCGNTAPLTINASRIAKIDMLGTRAILSNAGGRVTIPGGIGTNPIYIDYNP